MDGNCICKIFGLNRSCSRYHINNANTNKEGEGKGKSSKAGWQGSPLFNEMQSPKVQERQRRNIKTTKNKTKLPLQMIKITRMHIVEHTHNY